MTSEYHPSLLLIGRLIAGTCHGLTILTALIHAPEITSNGDVRHQVILTLGIVLGLSFVLPTLILIQFFHYKFVEKIIGVICLIQGGCVLFTNLFYVKESPSFILQKGCVDAEDVASSEAFKTFKIHQDVVGENTELLSRFSILKSYVADEKCRSPNILANGNGRPLAVCIAARLLSVLTFNVFTLYYNGQVIRELTRNSPTLPLVSLYLICGMITTIIFFNCIRHGMYLIIGALSIVNFTLVILMIWFHVMQIEYVFWLFILYVFCAVTFLYCFAMPLDVYGMINLSEAFDLSKKPFSIAFVLAIEYMVHILFYSSFKLKMQFVPWLIISVGLLVFSFLSYLGIPRNTHKLMLEKCPAAYK